jgi:catechol 2,3-dioxygenase-like lactoylglutathione lyase family enzyme
MARPPNLWVGSIVMECKDFPGMIDFWRQVLGYECVRPPTADWVILYDPRRKGPNISLQKVGRGPDKNYRYHYDLYSGDPRAEVRRLLALGAKMRAPARKGRDFVTLADPDGNPFDVIDKRGFSFGQRTSRR